MVCFAARPTRPTSPTRPTQHAKSAMDDNGQQIAHCLYVGGCRMVCFAARPTSPTSPTRPTQHAKSAAFCYQLLENYQYRCYFI